MSTYRSSNATAPVEVKVTAAAAGAGAGAIVGTFINWLIDAYLLTPGKEDGNPAPVTGFVMLLAASGIAFAAGYRAKHTARPADVAVDGPAPTA